MPCPLPLVGPGAISCQLPSANLGEVRGGVGIGFRIPSKDLARVTPSVVMFFGSQIGAWTCVLSEFCVKKDSLFLCQIINLGPPSCHFPKMNLGVAEIGITLLHFCSFFPSGKGGGWLCPSCRSSRQRSSSFLMGARTSLFLPLDGVLMHFVFFLGGCVIKRVDG